MNTLLFVANQFASGVKQITPLGHGLINDTYRVSTDSLTFVLQRINRSVFPKPEQIMANLSVLNHHVAQKNSATVKLQVPELLKTIDKLSFYQAENGDCWRAISYIADTQNLESLGSINHAEQVGFALGHFHRLVNDLNPLLLHDTLPGFHITPEYLKQYRQVLTQSTQQQNDDCKDFINRFGFISDELENAKNEGLLALRVIHGDPKLNNFLFDSHSQKIVSLIDLDTVKPGLVHYDIGDCLRSCCYITDPVSFDTDICRALLTNYLAEAGAFFTEADYRYLYPGIRLIPFELGLRFYTDYLQGNRYFKVTQVNQNLQRAINQFELCASIMSKELAIKNIVLQIKNRIS